MIQSGDGSFSQTISVTQPDDYDVKFADANGAIATITFHVVAPTTATTVPTSTAVKTVSTTPTVTYTPIPTPTKSPLPVCIVIGALLIAMLIACRIKKDLHKKSFKYSFFLMCAKPGNTFVPSGSILPQPGRPVFKKTGLATRLFIVSFSRDMPRSRAGQR